MASFYPMILATAFHAIDLITGFLGALRVHDIKSSKMRDGLFKKIGFIFCYLLAYIMDNYGEIVGLQIGVKVLPIIVLYAVMTEIVSIIENISRINPDLLPETLIKLFHVKDVDD